MKPNLQMMPEPTDEVAQPDLTRLQQALRSYVNREASRPVWITITRNRTIMVSVQRSWRHPTKWRLHQEFLHAPEPIWEAIRRYSERGRKQDWLPIQRFAQSISATSDSDSAPVRGTGDPALTAVFDEINQTYFNGQLNCNILWSPQRSRKRNRSIRYGSYDSDRNLIRIHPALKHPKVPRRFLEYIVFHEALHALVPPVNSGTRRRIHTKTFTLLERKFPDYDAMQKLAKSLVRIL